MGKKKRERKEQREAQKPRGAAPPPDWFGEGVSPEAQKVVEKLATGTIMSDEKYMMSLLEGADELRHEPELDVFQFDSGDVGEAMNRLLPKYERRLDEARTLNETELDEVYEELRVEAVEQLATRDWKREFTRSFDALVRRLMTGTDTRKLEQALLTRMMLDEKDVPWGANPVVAMIFEDAKEAAAERYELAGEMVQEMLREQYPNATDAELDAMLADEAFMKEFADKAVIPDELLPAMQELAEDALDEFEKEIFAGRVTLDLFTDEELDRTASRINDYAIERRLAGDITLDQETGNAIGEIVTSVVVEIMTPERLDEMEQELGRIADEWDKADNPAAGVLEIEQSELKEIEPQENHFLYCVLMGQLRRSAEPSEDTDAPDE